MYTATMCGKVFNKDGKEMKQRLNHKGYLQFSTFDGSRYTKHMVSRFVYAHFNGSIPDGMHVDHINNNKVDNRLCNLQLLTPTENVRKRQSNKLSMEKADEIRRLLGTMTGRQIAGEFGVSEATVSSIKHNERWKPYENSYGSGNRRPTR